MATYAEMQAVFEDIKADFRYDHELNGCLNCGICTATRATANRDDRWISTRKWMRAA